MIVVGSGQLISCGIIEIADGFVVAAGDARAVALGAEREGKY